jgi:tetratricopeptide (TPR) repeat protein
MSSNFLPTIKRVNRTAATEASIKRGKKLLADKRYDEALAEFENLVRDGQANAFVHLAIGRIKFRNQQADDALEHFSTAIELDPTHVQPYLRSGRIFYQRGELDKAREAFGNALRVNERSAIAHAAMGFVHLRAEQADQAIEAWSRALSFNPRMVPVRKRMALALQRIGRPTEAMAQAKAALRIQPTDPEAHAITGRLHLYAKQFDQALRAYRKAIELDPEQEKQGIRLGLAEACIGAGQLEEAEHLLNAVPQRDQFSALLHKLWGDLYSARGMHREALEEYRGAVLTSGQELDIEGFDALDAIADDGEDQRWGELAASAKRATSALMDARRDGIGAGRDA